MHQAFLAGLCLAFTWKVGPNFWGYVGKTGHQFAQHMKEHQNAVRRQDENSPLALHCLTTVHAFNWTRASTVWNGSTKRTREFIEARNITPASIYQCTEIDPCYKALLEYWKRKSMLLQATCGPPPFFILLFTWNPLLCCYLFNPLPFIHVSFNVTSSTTTSSIRLQHIQLKFSLIVIITLTLRSTFLYIKPPHSPV